MPCAGIFATHSRCATSKSCSPSAVWRRITRRSGVGFNVTVRTGTAAAPLLKPTNKSWRVDETYIRVRGRWCYLYRAIDSTARHQQGHLIAPIPSRLFATQARFSAGKADPSLQSSTNVQVRHAWLGLKSSDRPPHVINQLWKYGFRSVRLRAARNPGSTRHMGASGRLAAAGSKNLQLPIGCPLPPIPCS